MRKQLATASVLTVAVTSVLLSSATASIVTNIEILANAGAHNLFYNEFSGIPAISSTDLAQGIIPFAIAGGGSFATTDAGLTNGPDQVNGGSDGGILTGGGFATEGQYVARMRIDLGSVKSISAINGYTWHSGSRLDQVFHIYGATGSEPGLNLSPNANAIQSDPALVTSVDPTTVGWTSIAFVDSRTRNGNGTYTLNTNGQIGSTTFDNANSVLGNYRYLIFDIFAAGIATGGASSGYFGEIDVIAAVPEPSTLSLIVLGGVALLRRRR